MNDHYLIQRIFAYAGVRVQVRHWRVAKEHLPSSTRQTPVYYSPPALRSRGFHFSEHGGLTVVSLLANRPQFGIPPGDLLTRGVARCSMTDVFDRAVGRQLALQRAVEQLAFPTVVLDRIADMKENPTPVFE